MTFFETCPGKFIYNGCLLQAVPVLILEVPMKLLRHANPSTNCSDRKDRTARDTIHAADIHTLLLELTLLGELIDNMLLVYRGGVLSIVVIAASIRTLLSYFRLQHITQHKNKRS